MKIMIEEGTSVEKAIELLSSFLKDSYPEYPILKNGANIYITLKNEIGQMCPDNSLEFILSENGIENKMEKEKIEAIKECLRCWESYQRTVEYFVDESEKKVNGDLKYFEKAAMKGWPEKNIEKRKELHRVHLQKLENNKKNLELCKELNEHVMQKKNKFFVTKYTGRTPYQYGFTVALLFEDVNGFTGYFDGRGLHSGNYDATN